MSVIDLIEEDLWDHYSGLPNPTWYEYKKKIDEKNDTGSDIDMGSIEEQV